MPHLKWRASVLTLSFFKAAVLAIGLLFFCAPLASASSGVSSGPQPIRRLAPQPADDSTSRTSSAAEQFWIAADGMYQAVQEGEPLGVTLRLEDTEAALRDLPAERMVMPESMIALTESVTQVKFALAAKTVDEQRLQAAAGAVRLAADAIAHPINPLWLQYRELISDDIASLQHGFGTPPSKVSADAVAAYSRLSVHYELIRPAASLTDEPQTILRADSVLKYAERLVQAPHPDAKLLAGLIGPLQDTMNGLFPAVRDKPVTVPVYFPFSWGITAAIGSFIVSILTWSGWRRYRFERSHGKRRPRL